MHQTFDLFGGIGYKQFAARSRDIPAAIFLEYFELPGVFSKPIAIALGLRKTRVRTLDRREVLR